MAARAHWDQVEQDRHRRIIDARRGERGLDLLDLNDAVCDEHELKDVEADDLNRVLVGDGVDREHELEEIGEQEDAYAVSGVWRPPNGPRYTGRVLCSVGAPSRDTPSDRSNEPLTSMTASSEQTATTWAVSRRRNS